MRFSSLRRLGVRATGALFLTIAAVAIYPAFADNTAQVPPFSQNWTNIGLITVDDNWSGVPGIVGYRGDDAGTTGTGTDPRTITVADDPGVVDVTANQTNPNTFTTGGVAEFDIADDVVALQGSGTADVPYIKLHLNTTSRFGITLSYNVRDIDGSADNAIQQVNAQYRIGGSGVWTNITGTYIADATTGPSLATLVTPISVVLPAACDNQAQVQVRIMSTNAIGNDEWVGIDDISVTAATTLTFTTTTLIVTPAKTQLGEKVTLDAEVSPTPLDGKTVNFFDGVTPIGSASLVAGHAVLSISTLAIGSHSLTATYPGNATDKPSTSGAVVREVNPIATTTTLTADPPKTTFGDKVTLDATVSPIPNSGSTVNFFDGGSPIGSGNVDASGHATLSITTLGVGIHSLTATFKGDATHSASTSAAASHQVNPIATTTTLTADPPKTTYSDKVTLTATVSPTPDIGSTVNFFDGSNSIGSGTTNTAGQATLSISTLAVGNQSLTAKFKGDATHNSSTSNKVLHEVNPITTTTTLTADPPKTTYGEKVTLTATVSPIPSTGSSVNFFDGANPIGSGTTDASGVAILSITTLGVGTQSLTATFKGDATHSASTSSAVPHEVNPIATTTTLTTDPPKTAFGQKLTLTATVAPIPASGSTVNFFDGGNPIGSGSTDASGVATLSISTLAIGSHSLKATFKGDATHSASTSDKVNHEVNLLTSATTLVVTPAKTFSGEKVTLDAEVSPLPVPGSVVNFYDAGSPIGAANTDATGHAILSIATLAVGSHSLTATFKGDATHGASTSDKITHEVNPISDIAITAVCAADPLNKLCTSVVYVAQDWHVVFTVRNEGEKSIDNWSYDISLVQDGYPPIPLKTQVTGPPLGVAESRTINWDSPYMFTVTEVGDWSVVVTLTVKDLGNPDPNPINNQGTAAFTVNTKPTATLLSLFQAEPVARGLELRWQFGEPAEIAGVDLERSRSAAGPWAAVTTERRDEGGVTVALDAGVEAGVTYYYRLVARTTSGSTMTFGPLAGTAGSLLVDFALPRVTPNPARGAANIEFVVPRESKVRVSVVDLAGREMVLLRSGVLRAGRYQATWGGQTARGTAPAGLYFVRYQTPERNLAQRFAFIR